jgi:hypothetical protein
MQCSRTESRAFSENVDSGFIFSIHKLVKHLQLILFIIIGGKTLKQNITFKERKELEAKMVKVFKENVKGLSTELQKILVDDLVTAFQNRVNVLIRAQKKRSY